MTQSNNNFDNSEKSEQFNLALNKEQTISENNMGRADSEFKSEAYGSNRTVSESGSFDNAETIIISNC
jgi:hypothetical protein